MIVPASILTDQVLRMFRLKQLTLSTFALKEGIAARLALSGRI
jgi:exopolyphosphatase/pppGpp-phosphohydrolase